MYSESVWHAVDGVSSTSDTKTDTRYKKAFVESGFEFTTFDECFSEHKRIKLIYFLFKFRSYINQNKL